MKKILGLLVLFCSTLLVAGNASALSLSLKSHSVTADQGDHFFIDLVASDLGADVISAFDIQITYDSGIFSFFDISFGNNLGDLNFEAVAFPYFVPEGTGVFEISFLGPGPLAALQDVPSFSLATIEFYMDAQLNQGESTSIDFGNLLVFNTLGGNLTPTLQGATVSPTPEPTTLLIIGSAFGVFGWKKRKNLFN